ncbi:hypothetical protein AAW06_08720 [Escherichia coli]|nr:hypothetical protein AAW06_08720 [Escherichia coli]
MYGTDHLGKGRHHITTNSGNCVRGNGKLFNLKRKPWIMPDEVGVATVVNIIDTCPSGALKYRHK